jgi:hypothetical protein
VWVLIEHYGRQACNGELYSWMQARTFEPTHQRDVEAIWRRGMVIDLPSVQREKMYHLLKVPEHVVISQSVLRIFREGPTSYCQLFLQHAKGDGILPYNWLGLAVSARPVNGVGCRGQLF